MKTLRRGLAAGIATTTLLLAGCGAANESTPSGTGGGTGQASISGTIAGAGASSQAAAMEAWIAGFTSANPDATINYDPSGSGAGRDQFIGGGVAFAGSDAYLDEEELPQAQQRCGGPDSVLEIPVYISPIAVIYNLPEVSDLQLAPATVAKIFNRQITKWNDPAIQQDNPGKTLPDLAITPVNRSDELGTTDNYTEYLVAAAGSDWPHEASGDWPVPGGEAAQGTSGVVGAVQAGNGTIGYADASQAGPLGKVKVKVGAEYVGPTAEGAAAVVESSDRVQGQGQGQGQYSFAVDLARDTTDPTHYPIVLVSYDLACTTYPDAETANLVKAFLGYVNSQPGQQAAAQAAGSAPISDSQRSSFQSAIDSITAAG